MKLLFFDIDGTLIDSYHGKHYIEQDVKEAILRVQKAGHKIFLCTGRPRAMLTGDIMSLPFDGVISSNGGLVEAEGQTLFEGFMSYDLLVRTCDLLESLHCEYMIETGHHIYLDPTYQEIYDFFTAFEDPKIFTRDFDRNEVLKRTLKLEANVKNEDYDKVDAIIRRHFGYNVMYDNHGTENVFELYAPNLTKETGIQRLMDFYGVDIADTYAFGDGVNDVSMIEFCGVGVAMGNAVDEAKCVADYICPPVEACGLAHALQHLFTE